MTWTYSATALGTVLAKVRLEVGDTDTTDQLLTDEELQVLIDNRASVVTLAAADACDVLATRFARDFDFSTDGQSFSRHARAKTFQERAQALRERYHSLTTHPVTRVDGYSDDIDSRDVTTDTSPDFDVGRWEDLI